MREILAGLAHGAPVLIAGPTASGKSALAMEIADRLGGIVVNGDALQVYDCWRVLTARPTAEDEAAVPHALYGHVDWRSDYSVGAWLGEVEDLAKSGVIPVVVGGTGLYMSSVLTGLAEIPRIPAEVRREADALRLSDYPAMVAALDPATAARTDLKNPMRVQRAWEVLRATGRGLADWQRTAPPPPLAVPPENRLVLHAPADWLSPRIDLRFDLMMKAGALDEVRNLLPHWEPARPACKAIGAPELVNHLLRIADLDTAIALAKQSTRQFAKRQRTWFRSKMRDWLWVDP